MADCSHQPRPESTKNREVDRELGKQRNKFFSETDKTAQNGTAVVLQTPIKIIDASNEPPVPAATRSDPELAASGDSSPAPLPLSPSDRPLGSQ